VNLAVVEDGLTPKVGVVCECGWGLSLGIEPTLLDVLTAIGEHNSAAHLRPDNVGLRVRR